jgi:EamA-like transporter family protein
VSEPFLLRKPYHFPRRRNDATHAAVIRLPHRACAAAAGNPLGRVIHLYQAGGRNHFTSDIRCRANHHRQSVDAGFAAARCSPLICLSIFSTALAFTIYFRLLQTLGPLAATSQAYLRVPIGVAIGVVFLGEELSPTTLLGLLCLIAGVAAMTISRPDEVTVRIPVRAAIVAGAQAHLRRALRILSAGGRSSEVGELDRWHQRRLALANPPSTARGMLLGSRESIVVERGPHVPGRMIRKWIGSEQSGDRRARLQQPPQKIAEPRLLPSSEGREPHLPVEPRLMRNVP